jgi:hypothetical protein
MKITKRPKRVSIECEKVDAYIASYRCPSCMVIFKGGGPNRNVKRFICNCGQELIIDKFINAAKG